MKIPRKVCLRYQGKLVRKSAKVYGTASNLRLTRSVRGVFSMCTREIFGTWGHRLFRRGFSKSERRSSVTIAKSFPFTGNRTLFLQCGLYSTKMKSSLTSVLQSENTTTLLLTTSCTGDLSNTAGNTDTRYLTLG